MATINLEAVKKYQEGTYRKRPELRITNPGQALNFINERGFIFLWPIQGVNLPSLWTEVAGDRPVPNQHDDPGHITWGWKDDALGKRIWYYAKVLRYKATFISLEILPFFYALSENYGSPEEDYLVEYAEGRLTLAEKQVYEALLKNGPMHTIDLREAAHMTNPSSSAQFDRALARLQASFKILPTGVAEAGTWRYAFIYDITARHFTALPEEARRISEAEARQRLVELYVTSVGATRRRDVVHLFGWPAELAQRTIRHLEQSGFLAPASHPKQSGDWIALPSLCS